MDGLKTEVVSFVHSFVTNTTIYILAVGLIIAVISMLLIGLKLVLSRNGDDRAIVIENFKWVVIGIILLGVFIPIVSYVVMSTFQFG